MQKSSLLPEIKSNAHIGILGGTFNPPHLGHQLLALSFLALESLDELWIIPCQSQAFKQDILPFSHRYAMCERAFLRIKETRILDIENKLSVPSYTVNTIDFIVNEKPDIHLYFAIGSDLIDSFTQWHRADDIVKKARIIIFERSAFPIATIPVLLQSARVHRGYILPDRSSTNLRQVLKHTRKNLDPLLDRNVTAYIEENKLYS